jgi:Thiamine pyrophosphate enzyme, N-terminal TPP binding domain
MTTSHTRRSGAQVLIDQLRIHGTDTIFGVPGESYLAALDALYAQRNSIRFVICRQEGGAANMAEAYGKLTGKHPRPRGDQCQHRFAYRLPGFDAHDPAGRTGGARGH